MLSRLGKIVAFVTFVCFAVAAAEKKAKFRSRLGKATGKTTSKGTIPVYVVAVTMIL